MDSARKIRNGVSDQVVVRRGGGVQLGKREVKGLCSLGGPYRGVYISSATASRILIF